MPSRATYILKIHGRLNVPEGNNPDAEQEFKDLFPRPGVARGPDGAPWPEGFWLHGYEICHWVPTVESGREGTYTLLDFRAEINSFKRGQLYDNRDPLLIDVTWFYNYKAKNWHQDLLGRLSGFNERWRADILDEVWFRDWQWYCGNGGGK